jgi:hypothetical protein
MSQIDSLTRAYGQQLPTHPVQPAACSTTYTTEGAPAGKRWVVENYRRRSYGWTRRYLEPIPAAPQSVTAQNRRG